MATYTYTDKETITPKGKVWEMKLPGEKSENIVSCRYELHDITSFEITVDNNNWKPKTMLALGIMCETKSKIYDDQNNSILSI